MAHAAAQRKLFGEPAEPVRVGRYVIRRRLGAGGMGVVYVGFDEELEREIAIKLIAPERLAVDAEAERRRLTAEAQAIARLSHPNVIEVFDVGEHERGVYVAMELVDGLPLHLWIQTRQPSWRTVLGVMIAAGRGLAAAHEAGLVHRDFKPANVLVSHRREVKVLDFGLASEGPRLAGTSAVVGTPGYMAPEQRSGHADALSDQYAFCVTMHEALYGHRPRGHDPQGAIEVPLQVGRAPMRVWRAIEQGLSLSPAKRHASMPALLEALSRDHSRAPRRVAAAGLLGGGAVAGVWALLAPGPSRCKDEVAARLDGIWDGATRSAGATAFTSTGHAEASAAWAEVEQTLDAYARDWSEASRAACREVQQTETHATALDARILCLDRRLAELDAAVTILADADRETVSRAGEVADLRPVAVCDDPEALAAEVPPPVDPEQRRAVEAAEAALAEVAALSRSGRDLEAHRRMPTVLDAAMATGHRPTIAAVRGFHGRLLVALSRFEDADRVLEQAYLDALASGASTIAATAAEVQYRLHALSSESHEAERWERIAAAGVARLPESAVQHFNLLHTRSDVAGRRGDTRRALALAEAALAWVDSHQGTPRTRARALRALASSLAELGRGEEGLAAAQESTRLHREQLGPRHPLLFSSLYTEAGALLTLGRPEEAAAALEEGLRITVEARGETRHAAAAYDLLALARQTQGDLDAAIAAQTRALEIQRAILPPGSPDLGQQLANLSGHLHVQDRYDESLRLAQEAVELLEATLPPRHTFVAHAHILVGCNREELGELEAAVQSYELALSIFLEREGESAARSAVVRRNLGTSLRKLGRLEASRQHLVKARAVQEATVGPEHADVGTTLTALGQTLLELGELEEARAVLEEAVRIHEAHADVEPDDVATARFALAELLWTTGDRKRSHALAEEAAIGFAGVGASRRHEAVRAWLTARNVAR